MINVSRNEDPYTVTVKFEYSVEIISYIKLLPWRKYDGDKKAWIIKKCDLQNLTDNLGIYNFDFADADLKQIAEGNVPEKEIAYVGSMHRGITVAHTDDPYAVALTFPYNQEFLNAVKSLKYRNYQAESHTWVIQKNELYDLMMMLPNDTVTTRDPLLGIYVDECEVRTKASKAKAAEQKKEYLNVQLANNDLMLTMSRMPVVPDKPGQRLDFCKYDVFLSRYVTYAYNIGRIVKAEGLQTIRVDDARTKAELEFYFMNPDVPKRLETAKPAFRFDFKTKPLPHQIEGFNWGVYFDKFLIADEPGLGKTKQSIDIAVYRHRAGLVRKCIIVCGVNSTKYNWQAEIGIHSDEKCMIFDMSGEQAKLKALEEWKNNDVFFGIINIESLRYKDPIHKPSMHYSDGRNEDKDEKNSRKKAETRKKRDFLAGKLTADKLPINPVTAKINEIADMVIFDEIHKAKNASTKQGIALRQLTPKYRLGLSGTPLTNHAEDLWNILGWMQRNVYGYYQFKKRFTIEGGYRQEIGFRDLDLIHSQLKFCMLRRHKDDVIDLPEKVYETEYVEMTPRLKKAYKETRKKILDEIKESREKTGGTCEKGTNNPLTLALKLRELTSGATIEEVPEDLLKEEDNVKLMRIMEMLDETIIPSGRKAIIFSNYERITEVYRKALKKYNPGYIVGRVKPEDRQKEVDRFQTDPSCHIIIGTIGAMGTGLTLNKASYVFFVDKAWNETDNEQAEDRAHRIGAQNNITVITLVCKNTIDEKIEKKLAGKANLFSNAIDGKMSDWKEKHYGEYHPISSYDQAMSLLSDGQD